MLPWERLRDKLITIDGKPFASYKSLEGAYRFDRFVLYLDNIQVDPSGPPSSMRVRIDQAEARFPGELWSTRTRRVALQDYIARRWQDAIRKVVRGSRPGRATFSIDAGGQEVLERTSCKVAEDHIEIRGGVEFPADGRKVVGKAAQATLVEELPQFVDHALLFPNQNPLLAKRHVEMAEDAEALHAQLLERGVVAFLADGAVLPRESGTDRPRLSRLVTFQSPEELRITITLPHRGAVAGMGIPRGVTVIIGSGFSGRSTLLRAIAAGVYAHVPGDGREYCATLGDACLVRTDEGRRIEGVNLMPFITSLPGDDPTRYRHEHASEVISQAASLMEALEAGTSLLLIDEEHSAVALLMRDAVWRRLASEAKDPITPLADVVRALYEEHGVSTVLVPGVSTDYVRVADTVIAMDGFHPRVVTGQAKQAVADASWMGGEGRGRFGGIHHRVPLPDSMSPLRSRGLWGEAQGMRMVVLGREAIDLARAEQLVDPGQTKAIGAALVHMAEQGYVDGTRTLREILSLLETEIATRGLEVLSPHEVPRGDLALPRRQEIAAAFNRLRTLRVRT